MIQTTIDNIKPSKEMGVFSCEQLATLNIIGYNASRWPLCTGYLIDGVDASCIGQTKDMQSYFNIETDGIFGPNTTAKAKEKLKKISNRAEFTILKENTGLGNSRLNIILDGALDVTGKDIQKYKNKTIESDILPKIINILTSIAITVALVMMFISAIMLIVSGGDKSDFENAMTNFVFSAGGLIVVGLAYAFVKAILMVNFSF